MSNFTKGFTFADTGSAANLSAARLAQLIESADATPEFITGKTALTTTATDDLVLVSDTSASNALRAVTLGNLLPAASVTPAMLQTNQGYYAYSWRIKPTSGNGWVWMPGDSNSLLLQETTSAGAALDPFKIPLLVASGTDNNTLRLNATGVSIKTGADAAYPLDVGGVGRMAGAVVSKTIVPMFAFTDTGAEASAPYYAAWYMSNAYVFFGKLATEAGGADVTAGASVRLSVNAPNESLTLAPTTGYLGLGTTSPTARLHVAGDALVTGAVTATGGAILGVGDKPTSAGTAGTVGELRVAEKSTGVWALYVCLKTGAAGSALWREITGLTNV